MQEQWATQDKTDPAVSPKQAWASLGKLEGGARRCPMALNGLHRQASKLANACSDACPTPHG
jgi:hypothetical protein